MEIGHQDTCPAAGFRDVDEDAWYHEAVDYALDNGLMSGVSSREFAPGSTLTRAMVAQMLYSLEGKPAAGSADFADVAEGAWYADAISWAAGEGIVSGYGDTFGPNDPITREQLAAILYRYAKNEGYKTSQSGKGTELSLIHIYMCIRDRVQNSPRGTGRWKNMTQPYPDHIRLGPGEDSVILLDQTQLPNRLE